MLNKLRSVADRYDELCAVPNNRIFTPIPKRPPSSSGKKMTWSPLWRLFTPITPPCRKWTMHWN